MPFIRESIVTTTNADGTAHIAPLGVIEAEATLVLAPFHPSTTLENLRRHGYACVNYVTDVRIFAGCVSRRRRDWPVFSAERIEGWRLSAALAHSELEVIEIVEDAMRPRFVCAERHLACHAPFTGFNRAQAAVVEAAILVSRLPMLPAAKIEAELAYLQIAIDKTAGPVELEAWAWLTDAIIAHRSGTPSGAVSR